MIEHADILQTFAEIGAAFAGFGALVTAVSGRRRGGGVELTALHISVGGALIAVLGGVLPFTIAAHSPESAWVWRGAAAIVLVVNNAYALVYTRWIYRLRDGETTPLGTRLLFFLTESGLQLPLWALLLGFGTGREAALYLTAMTFLLFQAGLLFLGLVTSVATSTAKD